jgi:HK97 family phage portal protein
MGLFTSAHETRSSWTGPYSLKDPALNRVFGRGGQTSSGIVVSDELAMMCSVVFAAVNALASDIAKMPLTLMKRVKPSGSEPYWDSPVYHLLKDRPNPEMGAMQFRQALTAHALTLGGGYAEIERNPLGRPAALWPITPDRICADRDRSKRLVYIVDGKDTHRPENILHIHGLGWDGVTGYALINLARQAIGLMLATERYSSAFFGNNATFGGVISFDTTKDIEELKEYRTYIEDTYKGPEKAFRLLLLDASAKFSPLGGSKNSDAQLNELRDKQVEEVSRFFRIPVHKVNSMARATFNNIEHLDLEYYKGPILDWATLWEQECKYKLVPATEQRIQFFKHNANVFLRGDIKSRFEALGIARDKGVINANEWRDLEDMNPQPGEQGNQYLVQQAQIPADRIGDLADAEIKSKLAKAQPKTVGSAGSDEPLREALRQLEDARNLLDEARISHEDESAKRAHAEGALSAKAEEVARLSEEHMKAHFAVTKLTEDIANERIVGLDQARALSEAKAKVAETEVELAEKRRELEATEAEAREAKARAESVSEQLHNLSVIEAGLKSTVAMLSTEKAETESALTEARSVAETHEATIRELTERAETAEARAGAAVVEFAAAKDDAEAARQLAEEARAHADAAVTDKAAADAVAAEARAMAEQAQARLAESERALGAAQADVAQAEARIAEAKADAQREALGVVEARSTRNTDAEAKVVAAHRHMFVHVMRGAIERETDRARRAQQTPQKLQHWIDTWYDGHAELMRAALLPAVQVHLAWLGDETDAYELAAGLVAEHIATSRRQLAAVVNGDAEALAGSLAGLLRRWETERIHEIPDRLMEREVAHVRK